MSCMLLRAEIEFEDTPGAPMKSATTRGSIIVTKHGQHFKRRWFNTSTRWPSATFAPVSLVTTTDALDAAVRPTGADSVLTAFRRYHIYPSWKTSETSSNQARERGGGRGAIARK